MDSPRNTYERGMREKESGIANYYPDCDDNLPLEVRRRGVSLGDIGYWKCGKFHYLFNLTLPADDPANYGRVPHTFIPIQFDERKDVSSSSSHYSAPAVIHTTSITNYEVAASAGVESPVLAGIAGASFRVKFTRGNAEGAILVLPDGGSRHDIQPTRRFKTYVDKHAKSWFDFLENEYEVDELYLVTGCDKASSWGIATFSEASRGVETSIQFEAAASAEASGSVRYSWTATSTDCRTGPGVTNQFGKGCQNQCIFMRGLRISLKKDIAKARLFGSLKVNIVDETDPTRPATKSNTRLGRSGGTGSSSTSSFRLSPKRISDRSLRPSTSSEVWADFLDEHELGEEFMSPTDDISLGDIGYWKDGSFHCLINATLPANDPVSGGDAPRGLSHIQPDDQNDASFPSSQCSTQAGTGSSSPLSFSFSTKGGSDQSLHSHPFSYKDKTDLTDECVLGEEFMSSIGEGGTDYGPDTLVDASDQSNTLPDLRDESASSEHAEYKSSPVVSIDTLSGVGSGAVPSLSRSRLGLTIPFHRHRLPSLSLSGLMNNRIRYAASSFSHSFIPPHSTELGVCQERQFPAKKTSIRPRMRDGQLTVPSTPQNLHSGITMSSNSLAPLPSPFHPLHSQLHEAIPLPAPETSPTATDSAITTPPPSSGITVSSWRSPRSVFNPHYIPNIFAPATDMSKPTLNLSGSSPVSPNVVTQEAGYSLQPNLVSPPPVRIARVHTKRMKLALMKLRRTRRWEISRTCRARAITSRGNQRHHMKRHLRLRPHVCNFCGARFSALPIKDKHLRTCRNNPARSA